MGLNSHEIIGGQRTVIVIEQPRHLTETSAIQRISQLVLRDEER